MEVLAVARSVGGFSCSLILLGISIQSSMEFCQSVFLFPTSASMSMGLFETLLCRHILSTRLVPRLCQLPPVLSFCLEKKVSIFFGLWINFWRSNFV